jgi:predicted transport protein
MMEAVSTGLEDRTGRTLGEWVEAVSASGLDPLDQNAVRRWLKSEHAVPQNSQWAIADAAARAAGWERPSVEEYVASQYAGPKAHLRPIYDRLADELLSLGDDVTVEGRSTYTPFVRRRQFVAIAAASRSRVDLGLRFTDPPADPRLLITKPVGQTTHRIELTTPADVDDTIIGLARLAYEQNG